MPQQPVGDPCPQPRTEYPRPQLVRPDWLCLNGTWQFEVDRSDSGLERGLRERELSGRIIVPFAPESVRSGVGETGYLEAVWYRREVTLPEEWAGRRVLLHFGAVDHDATVWVGGVEVGRHRGGFTSFALDITRALRAGEPAVVVVRARDSHQGVQARGKQSTEPANRGCRYTRTTGIWQTVWLEAVPAVHLRRPVIVPDVAGAAFHLDLPVSANRRGWSVRATLSDADGVVAVERTRTDLDLTPRATLHVPASRARLWQPGDPYLYDLVLELLDDTGAAVDTVTSYAGLRSVAIDGDRFLLNGRPVFQRLVLDQGYWPDTLLTAPSDAALRRDIDLALEAGFTGARVHQRVAEERYLYHADRAGFLVWGEFPDWGAEVDGPRGERQRPTPSFVAQWQEAVARDRNHPSIVGWCPLNETGQLLHDRITVLDDATRAMFLAAKLADPSRPVLDASGYSHRVPEADVYDAHDYEQDPVRFADELAGLAEGGPYANRGEDGEAWSVPYQGQPYFVSEFGGIWWDSDARDAAGHDERCSWGYGERPGSEDDVYKRFAALTAVLLDDPSMFGYCYTQLTDTFQEKNGVVGFDRARKLDLSRLREAQQRPAAYETRVD